METIINVLKTVSVDQMIPAHIKVYVKTKDGIFRDVHGWALLRTEDKGQAIQGIIPMIMDSKGLIPAHYIYDNDYELVTERTYMEELIKAEEKQKPDIL